MFNAEFDADEIGGTSEHCMHRVEQRRDEQEGELDWLSNAGEERSQRG